MSGRRFESLDALYQFLRSESEQESRLHFGITKKAIFDQVAQNWFDDARNYDGRWEVLEKRGRQHGRVLDMAAGCGTFLLYGLRQGYDVVGVEPEQWKRDYFQEKVRLSGYPAEWAERILDGVGERLPFPDASFDVVTSYQTLEHVTDVRASLEEMLRVLRPGGVLYLRAPDYASFFEPHYRLPFLPCMNRRLATMYLRLLRRPVSGLQTLNWTTTRGVVRMLRASGQPLTIASHQQLLIQDRFARMRPQRLPRWLQAPAERLFAALAWTYFRARELAHVGRRERFINLWVTRLPGQ
jgi:ubiquinone/menaquinone biosynthesis C-methylase UbiE